VFGSDSNSVQVNWEWKSQDGAWLPLCDLQMVKVN
jgi:hypothetical protein